MQDKANILGFLGGGALGAVTGLATHASLAALAIGILVAAQLGLFIGAICREKELALLHVVIVWVPTIIVGMVAGLFLSPIVGALFGTPVGMIVGSWGALQVVSQLTRPPQFERGHCPTCGYDLRGTPGNRCPECGNSFVYRQVFGHDRIRDR